MTDDARNIGTVAGAAAAATAAAAAAAVTQSIRHGLVSDTSRTRTTDSVTQRAETCRQAAGRSLRTVDTIVPARSF